MSIGKKFEVDITTTETTCEYSHPSYGLVSFSRCNCTPKNLFGSNIKHTSYITLRIGGSIATQDKDLHQDKIKSNYERYIEVALTSSQFAELLTSMNIGEGVPCTISFMKNVGLIEYSQPYNENLDERSDRMLDVERQRNTNRMKELKRDINTILEKKTALTKEEKRNLKLNLDRFISLSERGMEFAEKCFEEEVEKQKQKIKTEIDATLALMKSKMTLESTPYINEIE